VNITEALRTNFGWSHVDVAVLKDGQHYVVEERPDDVIELIERVTTPRTERNDQASGSPWRPP
jgi:hypothetical protein